MQVSHSPDRIAVRFDDDHAVADAGLILPASLAEGLLLRELFDTHVELGDAPQLTVQSNAIPSLELRDLERAIHKLPEEQRSVILLIGLEGMRYEEVAAVLDVPVGTVRSRLSRGRDQLRRLMGMQGRLGDNEQLQAA